MDASTTINQMLSGNKIFVPTYQRAFFESAVFLQMGGLDAYYVFAFGEVGE